MGYFKVDLSIESYGFITEVHPDRLPPWSENKNSAISSAPGRHKFRNHYLESLGKLKRRKMVAALFSKTKLNYSIAT
jgi:hypothetical protein